MKSTNPSAKIGRTAAPAAIVLPPPMLHTRWLHYRLLMGDSNEALRAQLTADDLPAPADAILNAIRSAFDLPRVFNPTSRTHKASRAFILGSDCWPLFEQHDMREQALRILRAPRVREVVESGALLGVPHAAVVTTLATHLRLTDVTSGALQIYGSAFFETSRFTRAQLKIVVQQSVRQAVVRVAGGEEDGPPVRRALSSDPRMVAVSLPSSPVAWNAVLMAMGFAPGRFELAKIVDQLETVAATRAAQALLRGGRDDERRAEGFTRVLRGLREIHGGAVSPDDELKNKLMQFKMQNDTSPVVGINELRRRGEEVTTDLVPPMDPHVERGDPFGDDAEGFDEAVGDR